MPRKTKAIKVTDKNAPWNNRAKPSKYNLASRPLKKTILIVCEGQTEEMYFKAFPVITSFKVETYNTSGQSKLKLVESTKSIIKSYDIKFDEVWCVFDMDIKRGQDEFSDFDNSINKAKDLGYKVTYSNDAFELWFYLHYQFTDNQNRRTFYYKELSKRFKINYEDDGKKYNFCSNLYLTLFNDPNASQNKAIERGKQLYLEQKGLKFHQQNPITTVYELVEELNKNLRH